MERTDWQRNASIIICAVAGIFGIWLVFRYVLGAVLPFLIAWAVAVAVTPAAGWLAGKTGVSKKICSAVLLIVFLIFITWSVTAAIRRLIYELEELLRWLMNESEVWDTDGLLAKLSAAVKKIPFLGKLFSNGEGELLREKVITMLTETVSGLLTRLGAFIPSAAFGVISHLPSVLMSFIVTVISCFYFTFDLDRIHSFVFSLIPAKLSERCKGIKTIFFSAAGKFVKAYSLIFLITFFELLIGFMILKSGYAMILALICAFVDLLPILGIGTVLLPWAVWEFISHDFFMGFGLLAMYVVITVLRQITEPKIIGNSFGVHPILTLVSMFAGLKLFGIMGMILLPGIVMTLGAVAKRKKIEQ